MKATASDSRRGVARHPVLVVLGLIVVGLALAWVLAFVPLGTHDLAPGATASGLHLDPGSPWPKFRANGLQNGRSAVLPRLDAGARPWTYPTGKGIFSSPVVDGEGTVYVGSADQNFYALRRDGSLKWKFATEGIIDSSALLDDQGRVYFGSGDQHVYCLDRATGSLVWRFKAQSVEEVQAEFKVTTHNVAWFEGNLGMLPDGSLLAPNDNQVVYRLDRETGRRIGQFLGNEMVWSLPAVNPATERLFFGTTFLALKTVFGYDAQSGKKLWTRGGLGSVAATPLLTSENPRGGLVVGGFDGYVRALAQDSGKTLWSFGARDHIYASPAQLADGTIIQPSADGTVYALDPRTGRKKWAFDTREPIRSSPAVGGDGRIYLGSGEGKLYCLEPTGALRWSYRCIEDDRNDLNASPALGAEGVYIAGESGGIFFVPYDYPLSPQGRADPRCAQGPGEDLPKDGAFLLWTSRFGDQGQGAPASLAANEPITLSLFVRKDGDSLAAALDRDSVKAEVSGSPNFTLAVAANGAFLTLVPREAWAGAGGGEVSVKVTATYRTGMGRFGLKFLGGRRAGKAEARLSLKVPPRTQAPMPYGLPENGRQTVFELSRLAAPNPTMLPSWNQIGFDSLHYLAGLVAPLPGGQGGTRALLWVVGGKREAGATVADPSLAARYPLVLDWDGGLVTLHNYDGFKINFVGSWEMPFSLYRLASRADPRSGAFLDKASFTAVALCDQIKFYGLGLKLMGLTEADTGKMTVSGGMDLGLAGEARAVPALARGEAEFRLGDTEAWATLGPGAGLAQGAHVYSLLLVDEAGGQALPLQYTTDTRVEANAAGLVTRVSVGLSKGGLKARARAYLMVDTMPVAQGLLEPRP